MTSLPSVCMARAVLVLKVNVLKLSISTKVARCAATMMKKQSKAYLFAIY